jgi:hypothetical protein
MKLIKLLTTLFFILGLTEVRSQSWSMPTHSIATDTVINFGTACTFDNSGNTYWAGTYKSLLDPLATGIYIWKVDATGNIINTLAIPKSYSSWNLEAVAAMKVIRGALYVHLSANYASSPFDIDVILTKYNLNLVKQWERYYNGPGNTDDYAVKFMSGPNNSILLLINAGGNSIIEKLSPSTGSTINTVTFDLSGDENSVDMYVNNSNVYIGGTTSVGTLSNIYLSRFTNTLAQDWYVTWDASGNNRPSNLSAMVMDTTGNIHLGGQYQTSGGGNRCFFAKFIKSTGNRLWTTRPTNAGLGVVGMRLDGAQNLMAFLGSPIHQRFIKLNGSTGAITQNKVTIYDHPDLDYTARDFRAGSGNNFYVMAEYDSFYNAGSQWELGGIITKFNGSGTRIFDEYLTTWRADLSITPATFETTPDDRVLYITNNSDVTLGPLEFYAQTGVLDFQVSPRISNETESNKSILLYPQPAHDHLRIDLLAAEIQPETISIYTSQGQLIEIIAVQPNQQYVDLKLSEYKSGMYLVSCLENDMTFTSKFVKE